jgi:branched-chain amino acid transport system ATP-binding protein
MTEAKALLDVTGIHVRYGAAFAVGDVSFSVRAGSVLAVLGANGAGKSSIARACSGLVPVASGAIRFDGEEITNWRPERIRRAGLVYLPEGRGVFPNLSVLDNLRVAARLVADRQAAFEKAFQLFPILESRRSQRAGTLSGGEQQMLSLARAMITEPRLVIIDEPSLGLAPLLIDLVFESLSQVKRNGVSLVVIEQFAHRALALADECVILNRGSVGWAGPAAAAPASLEEHYMGT